MTTGRRVGLVAPLPPQVGGVVSVAEWLLAHEGEIGCCYEPFDLWRPPGDEMGGRLRLASIPRQARLLLRFLRWLGPAPRLVHYCVSCSATGLSRDLVFIALLRLTGRTTIAHVHGSDLSGFQGLSLRSLPLRLLSRLTAERVAVAPPSAAALRRLGVSSGCIFNPVRFDGNGHKRQPSTTLRLLFVGTYGERKGCPELIEALAEAREVGVDASLRFVGKEEHRGEENRLRREVEARGLGRAVEFAGMKNPPELRSCYEWADVICLPSKREQLPMALLEGMAFGLTPLSTPVGGIPDLVEDGVTGLLVEPGDVTALAEAIRMLAAEPDRRVRMGEAARARVEATAGPRAIAAQWREVYSRYESRNSTRESDERSG